MIYNWPGKLCFVLLILLVSQSADAAGPTFPQLTGRVVDEAGLLDPAAVQSLEQLSGDLEAKTSDQLVVVTLSSLRGYDISDYGYQLGRSWAIGQKGKDNGILLIVAPKERKVRIEVGYGVEGPLTDAISSIIIQQSIIPRFKAGDYSGGIMRGAQDIVQVLTADPSDWQKRAQARETRGEDAHFGGAFFLGLIILFFLMRLAQSRRRGSRLGPFGPRRHTSALDVLPWILWSGGGRGGGGGGGGFRGGGGSFGGGGASGGW